MSLPRLAAALLAVPLLAVSLPSAPATAGTPYVVTLTSSSTTVTYGGKVLLRGAVSPTAAGQRVAVQRRIESGAWTTISRPLIGRDNRYAVAVTPAPGRTTFRVIKAATRGHAGDVSPAVFVNAWRWRSLVGVAPVASNDLRTGTFPQHGYTYGAGVSLGNGGYVEWRVRAWRCIRVRATIGVAQTSPDLTRFIAGVSWKEDLGDDLGYAEHGLGVEDSPRLFQAETRASGILADDSVQLEAYEVDGNPPSSSARLVFAAPAVYCNS